MRLHRIEVEHVRGLRRAAVTLADAGVTVIEAPNEAGKTTLLDAFDLLLAEKDSTKKQVVRDLQPVGEDVGSLVEAELSLGPMRLTVRKRFNRRTMTELTVHGGSGQQLTGDDAHDRLRELLAEHTDLTLYEALRLRQGRSLDSLTLGDSATLARRLDEIAGGTGDGGDDALLDRIRGEFERYFSPKGHPGRLLRDADTEVEAAQSRRDELADTAAALEADVDRIEQLDREHREVAADIDRLEPAVAAHRDRVERVRELREQVATLEARAQAADAELERCRRDRDERVALAASVSQLAQGVAADEPEVLRARERLGEQQQRLEALRAELETAERRESAARETRDAARELAELGRRRQELDGLQARARRIEQALEDARSAEAALAATPLSDAQLEEVRGADDQVRLAEARLGDAAPTVTVHAVRDLRIEVDGAEHELAAGDRLNAAVPETWQLSLPDHLEVTVRAGTSLATRQEELAEARQRLAAACREIGVEDRAQADALAEQQRLHRRALEERDGVIERELEGRTREELDESIRTRSAQLDALEARVSARGDALSDQLPLELEAADDRVAQLDTSESEAREVADELRRDHAALAEQVRQLGARVSVDETRLAEQQRRLAEEQARLDAERERQDDAALDAALDRARASAEEAHAAVGTARGELDELGADEAELLAANDEQRLTAAQQRLDAVRDELTRLRVGVELRGGEGIGEALQAAEAELERAQDRRRRLRARAQAARTLLRTFEEARDAAYAAYREPLRERIVRAGRIVFGDELDIELDEQLTVVARRLGTTRLAWDQLSAGAREQLAILTALAAADLAGGDADDGVPLVLDDTLGYTDPERLERLGAVLGSVRGPQVVVLTCVGERFRTIGGAEVVRLHDTAEA